MKKLIIVLLGFFVVVLTGCDERSKTDRKQAEATEAIQAEADRRLGLPNIRNFQEKRLVKELYELRDQSDLATYTYTFSEATGELRFLAKSIGFGIPAAVQYSNPERIAVKDTYGIANLPQAEPNGLFMPSSTTATWVFVIDPIKKEPVPLYVEPLITVSPFPLQHAVYPKSGPTYEELVTQRKG